MTTNSFVLELGCEEIPHDILPKAAAELQKNFEAAFNKVGASYKQAQNYFTPKRLVVHFSQVSERIAEKVIVRRGPAYEKTPSPALKKAIDGFANSILAKLPASEQNSFTGVKNGKLEIESLQPKSFASDAAGFYVQPGSTPNGKSNIIFYQKQPSTGVLQQLVASLGVAISNLRFDEAMYWGKLSGPFIRPVRSIFAMLGNEVVPITAFGLTATASTFSHRFYSAKAANEGKTEFVVDGEHVLAAHSVTVNNAESYFTALRSVGVVLSHEERCNKISLEITQLEEQEGVKISEACKKNLIGLNAALTESPVVFASEFATKFLRVPNAVLESEMIEHQKYFPTYVGNKLSNVFFVVSNMPVTPQIIAGNYAVLSARLADGAFLYDVDVSTGMLFMANKLRSVQFYEGVGSYASLCYLKYVQPFLMPSLRYLFEKKYYEEGMENLSKEIEQEDSSNGLAQKETGLLRQSSAWFLTCLLMKADLTSEVVKEFPEVQGVMGAHYLINAKDEALTKILNVAKKFDATQKEFISEFISNKNISASENTSFITQNGKNKGENKKVQKRRYLHLEVAEAIAALYVVSAESIANGSLLEKRITFIDKITDVVSLFAAGAVATGSEDVFGLRRKVAAVVEQLILTREEFSISIHITQLLLLLGRFLHLQPSLISPGQGVTQFFHEELSAASGNNAAGTKGEGEENHNSTKKPAKIPSLPHEFLNFANLQRLNMGFNTSTFSRYDGALASTYLHCNAELNAATEQKLQAQLAKQLLFFNVRLKTSLNKRYNQQMVAALLPQPVFFQQKSGKILAIMNIDPFSAHWLLQELQIFIAETNLETVTGIVLACKRITNILGKTEIMTNNQVGEETPVKVLSKDNAEKLTMELHLFNSEAERSLHYALLQCNAQRRGLNNTGGNPFASSLLLLDPLIAFFEKVMVNDSDERRKNNRLALLWHVLQALNFGINWQKLNFSTSE